MAAHMDPATSALQCRFSRCDMDPYLDPYGSCLMRLMCLLRALG
jgi:hypothetical protein